MLKEVLYDSFENLEIKRISLENPASVDGKIFFLIRIFYLSAAVAIATFEICGWKFSGHLILIPSVATLVNTTVQFADEN